MADLKGDKKRSLHDAGRNNDVTESFSQKKPRVSRDTKRKNSQENDDLLEIVPQSVSHADGDVNRNASAGARSVYAEFPDCQSVPNRTVPHNISPSPTSIRIRNLPVLEPNTESIIVIDDDSTDNEAVQNGVLDNNVAVLPNSHMALRFSATVALEAYSHLLDDSEQKIARRIGGIRSDPDTLSDSALHLLSLLYSPDGQTTWISRVGIEEEYEEYAVKFGPNSFDAASVELQKVGLILATDSTHVRNRHETAADLLPTLPSEELRYYYRMIPELSKTANKDVYLQKLQELFTPKEAVTPSAASKRIFRQSTLSAIPCADRVANAIIKKNFNNSCLKMKSETSSAIHRINFVIESSGNAFPDDLFLQSKLPQYQVSRGTHLFTSRGQLLAYTDARELERRTDEAISKRKHKLAVQLGDVAAILIQPSSMENNDAIGVDDDLKLKFPNLFNYHGDMSNEKTFLKRFTPSWVCLKVLWNSITSLEARRMYEQALERLELILSTDIPITAKWRGQALIKLCNILKQQKKPLAAFNLIVDALENSNYILDIGDRCKLASHAAQLHEKIRLEGRPKRQFKKNELEEKMEEIKESMPDCVKNILGTYARNIGEEICYGKPTAENVVGEEICEETKHSFSRDGLTFKKEIKSETGARKCVEYDSMNSGKEPVSAEQLACQFFEKRGWNVCHDDGGIIRLLFGLLMWESAIFAPVENVFHSPYQDKPLDLLTETFYTTRKVSIDGRLEYLKGLLPIQLEEETRSLYKTYDGTLAFGCIWKKYPEEMLVSIARGIGPQGIAAICGLLAKNYSYWSDGIADLILYGTKKKKVTAKFITILNEKEKLSPRQKGWICHLLESKVGLGILRITHVELDG